MSAKPGSGEEVPSETPIEFNSDGAIRAPSLTWPSLPELPKLSGSTILGFGRQFYLHSPHTILQLGGNKGEALMTELAHELLGPVVPHLDALVKITEYEDEEGILISRQPGEPLLDLWPTLSPQQRTTVKKNLVDLLLRMRTRRQDLNYYGRPGGQPYVTISDLGPNPTDVHCRTRSEWNTSRIQAVSAAAAEVEIDEARVQALEKVQKETGNGAALVEAPVLTHGDLSNRNILLDPTTLEVTGLIDWEEANVAPAYFEYAVACLSGGHQPDWRRELLEVLRGVLRVECEREVAERGEESDSRSKEESCEELFKETLGSRDALLNVERPAQGFSDACYWTFENKF